MKIYAVIITYNAMRRNWIDKCLTSLRLSTIPVTPVVVDNLSTDDSRVYIPSRFPEVIWLPQDANLGFGQANNIGIQYALQNNANYILLLNQDATIAPDTLQHLIATNDENALLTPVHLNGDGTRLDMMFSYLVHINDNTIVDDVLSGKGLSASYRIGRVNAACWLLPTKVVKNVGGFNPLFYHYGEDENYLQRLSFHGIPTVLVPKAKMYHDREVHGNVTVFNNKRLRRDLLLISSNINLTKRQRIIKLFRRLYECYAWELSQRQYMPFTWTKELFWIILHYRQIRNSIINEIKKGQTWL